MACRAARGDRPFPGAAELFKQGVIELDQGEQFGEIDVLWTGGLEPVAAGSIAIDDYEG